MNPEYIVIIPGTKKYSLTPNGLEVLSKELENGASYLQIAKTFDIGADTLAKIAKEYNIYRDNRRKFTIDENYFSKIDSKEKAYWLGFLSADGYIDQDRGIIALGLQPSDEGHIQKFLDAIHSNKPIKTVNHFFNNKNHEGKYVHLNSKKMTSDLLRLGLYRKKSLTYTPPTAEQVPTIYLKYWLLGYFDGDGCLTVYESRGTMRYKMGFLGTKETIDFIQKYLGTNKNVHKAHRCENNTYEVKYTETDTKTILDFLYGDVDPNMCLERKYKKYLEICEIWRKRRGL